MVSERYNPRLAVCGQAVKQFLSDLPAFMLRTSKQGSAQGGEP